MKTINLKAKLDDMVDKVFTYANTEHTVKGVEINEDTETFIIKTDKNRFSRKFESAEAFLPYWFEKQANKIINNMQQSSKEVGRNEQLPAQEVAVVVLPEADNSLMAQLTEVLMDNIKKVQASPGYIKQAEAVKKSADSIVNIQRMKLDYLKTMRKK